MSSAASALNESILHPSVYPELGAEQWCRVLSPEVVASCSGCGYAIREGVHASDVVYGFYCAACCPACRAMPTKADREVMARNVEAKIPGFDARGHFRGERMRYARVKSLTIVMGREAKATPKADPGPIPMAQPPATQGKQRKTRLLPLTAWGKPFSLPALPDRIRTVRAGSKIARGIDLLARAQGATLGELRDRLKVKTDIKAWLSYDLRTRCGYGYSTPRCDCSEPSSEM